MLDLKVEVSAEPVVEGGLLNVTGCDQLNERDVSVDMIEWLVWKPSEAVMGQDAPAY